MHRLQALDRARGLVEQAIEVAGKAGIDPQEVVAPHCLETTTQDGDSVRQAERRLRWCGVTVAIDDNTTGLFEMSEPDDDPAQEATFLVTTSTAAFVRQDFARYKSALERMAERWREDKARVLAEKRGGS